MNERGTSLVLLVLLTAQLVLLAAQIPDPGQHRSLLERSLLRVVGPLFRGVSAVADGFEGAVSTVRTTEALRREVRRLEAENEALREEHVRLFGLEQQTQPLRTLLDYQPPAAGEPRLADVVYIDHLSWLRTLILYLPHSEKDSDVDLLDAPVASAEGLVGRIVGRAGAYAKVQLVTDRTASVGAMIERTRRQGIVRGAEGGLLTLDYLPLQADVRPGDRIITAGIDGVFPRGIPVGTVIAVEPGEDLFHRVQLTPAVDLGRLDRVYVLGRVVLPEELKGATVARP